MDGPTAAGGHARDDSMAVVARAADGRAAWFLALPAACAQAGESALVSLAACAQVGAIVLALQALCVWDASQAWDVLRAVAVARCWSRQGGVQVWPLAAPPVLPLAAGPVLRRVSRPAQVWFAEDPVDGPAHAMPKAALRRDSKREIRATAAKTVFPSPFFFL